MSNPKTVYQPFTLKDVDIIYTNLITPRENKLKKDAKTGANVHEYSCTVLIKKNSPELTRFVTAFQKFKTDNFGQIQLTHKVAKDGDELYAKLLEKAKAEKQGFMSNEELAEFEKNYGRLKGTVYLVPKAKAGEGLDKPLLLQEGFRKPANPDSHEDMGKFFSGMKGNVQFVMATYHEPVKGVTLYLKIVQPISGGTPFGKKGSKGYDLDEMDDSADNADNPSAYKAAEVTEQQVEAMFA